MKNKELYDKTVGILVDAYFNDTLKAGTCCACACGNLIAANQGVEIILVNGQASWVKGNKNVPTLWKNVLFTRKTVWFGKSVHEEQVINLINFEGMLAQIESMVSKYQELINAQNSILSRLEKLI